LIAGATALFFWLMPAAQASRDGSSTATGERSAPSPERAKTSVEPRPDSQAVEAVREMSFEELMQSQIDDLMRVTIVSASKKEEPLHEAPLAAAVITRDEIRASGATCIAEALRLAPGVLVREYVSGGHDIHIRGFSGIPPEGDFDTWTNTLTLVMVDGRVSYNYYDGGTFWETLPVAISDVERIEIVAGPAAALYGPNAVTGVINIITRTPSQPGLRVTGRTSTGARGVRIARLRVGAVQAESAVEYQQGNLSGRFSVHAQQNQRTWDKYYSWFHNGYIDADDERSGHGLSFGRQETAYRHPEPSLAVRRMGAWRPRPG
jgi:iron complex outermembrane receptor protein